MKTNKIIALFTALVLVLGLFSVQISAADANNAVVWVENVEANAGEEVTVTVKANAIAALFTFEVAYDAEKFAYVADSFAAENAVALISAEAGKITFGRSESSNVTYDDAVVATFKLATPAADNAVFAEAARFSSDVTIAVVEADLGGFTEPDFYNADGTNLVIGEGYTATFTKGAVTVKKAHTLPTFTANIAGTAMNGETLTASASDFVDNWSLTPVYTYQWYKDGVAIEGATAETLSLTAAEIGAVIKVVITATVEADEFAVATAEAATTEVVKNPAYLPAVTNVVFSTTDVKVGTEVAVSYDYEDGNALDDASVVTFVKAAAADATEWAVAEEGVDYTVADGIVKFTKEVKNMFIKASVLATNADDVTAAEATLSVEAIEVKPNPPVVTDIEFTIEPSKIKVGTEFGVIYNYIDANAVPNASVVSFVKAEEVDATEWVAAEEGVDYTVEDGVYEFTKAVKGMYIKAVVLATNADGDVAAEATESEAFIVKAKATSSGGGLTGPNLAKPVVKPEEPKEEEPKEEEPTVVDPIKSAPADKLVLAIGKTDVAVFGEVVANDVAPVIINDRTMLPARIVAESLGAEVAWDGEARVVTITKGDVVIVLTIDSNKALVNGEEVELDSAAFIQNDRTYTPIRFVAEALAATVEWDADTQAVTITPAK